MSSVTTCRNRFGAFAGFHVRMNQMIHGLLEYSQLTHSGNQEEVFPLSDAVAWAEGNLKMAIPNRAQLSSSMIRADGIGPEFHAHGHEYPGAGVGLALCKRIVERHAVRFPSIPSSDAVRSFTFACRQLSR